MFEFKIAATRCSYAETDTAIAPVVVSIFTDLLLGTQPFKTMDLVYFILQDNTSYNSIYIYAPSLPMSSRT
jgi:hypothetical protein